MNDKVVEAQRDIISALSRWELTIAELYAQYAERFPEKSVFWKKMEKEERGHSAMLETLLVKLDQGALFYNLGQFDWDGLEKEIAIILKALAEAKEDEPLTLEQAFLQAVKIESSMLESSFYSTAQSSDPVFKHVAAALSKATKQHFLELQKQLQELMAG